MMRDWKPAKRTKGGGRRETPAVSRGKADNMRIYFPHHLEKGATHVAVLEADGVLGFRFGDTGVKLLRPSPGAAARIINLPKWAGRLYPFGTTDVELVEENGVHVLTLPKGDT